MRSVQSVVLSQAGIQNLADQQKKRPRITSIHELQRIKKKPNKMCRVKFPSTQNQSEQEKKDVAATVSEATVAPPLEVLEPALSDNYSDDKPRDDSMSCNKVVLVALKSCKPSNLEDMVNRFQKIKVTKHTKGMPKEDMGKDGMIDEGALTF